MLKDKSVLHGLVFVFLFVVQQIVAFVFLPFKLVSVYWLVVLLMIMYTAGRLPLGHKMFRLPLFFTIVSAFFALLTVFVGEQVGNAVVKALYAFIAFTGFVFISVNRINLKVFDFLLVLLYAFFYINYFALSDMTRLALDGNLFGHSSSNTIAIVLNGVLFIYYVLGRNESKSTRVKIFAFALINIVLIVIQGSRAGIGVAFVLLLLTFLALTAFMRGKVRPYLVTVLVFFSILYYFQEQIWAFLESNKMEGVERFEENVRSTAQASFFKNLSFETAFLGFPRDFEFAYDVTRTFNAFLDFWSRYGIGPFFLLVILFFRRIVYFRRYSIPLLSITPIVVYSFVESIWGGALWDLLLFVMLFYGYQNTNNYVTKNKKNI